MFALAASSRSGRFTLIFHLYYICLLFSCSFTIAVVSGGVLGVVLVVIVLLLLFDMLLRLVLMLFLELLWLNVAYLV